MSGERRPRQRAAPPPLCWVGPGGLRLILREDHASPVTAITASFLGGTRFETPSRQGLSYFTQRLSARGTLSRSSEEVAEAFEFVGAAFSPFAAKDLFGASLTLLSRHFETGLRLLVECLRWPAFEPDELERERRNLLLELSRRPEDTLAWSMELAEALLYRRHPYRFPVRGGRSSAERWTRADLVAWHRRTFTPDRLVISVVGDQRPERVRQLVDEVFAGFEPSGWCPSSGVLEAPPLTRRVRTERREKRQAAVVLAFLAPRFGTEEADAFEVLHHILAGMGSRLFVELRDRQGLGYVVNCNLDARFDSGCFKVYALVPSAQASRARQALLEQLERLRHEPVSSAELLRAKKYMLGLFEISQQRKSTQAFRLAMCELLGAGFAAVEDYPRRIRSVTAERVMLVAQRYLDTQNYCCAQVLGARETARVLTP